MTTPAYRLFLTAFVLAGLLLSMRQDPPVTYTVDRIVGGFAVLEGPDSMIDVPADRLPPTAAEGTVLRSYAGRLVVDLDATEARLTEARRLLDSIRKEN